MTRSASPGWNPILRWRLKFSRGEELKYISHLDMMRLWERALRRAALPLAYSQGFSPHPHITLASPLAVGVTSEAELADIYITRPMAPDLFKAAILAQMPRGIQLLSGHPVHATAPSLPSLVQWAEYKVEVESNLSQPAIEAAIQALLSAEIFPWQHRRDTGIHSYDLRALISDIKLLQFQTGTASLWMKVRCGNLGSGRPEQITAALGFTHQPHSIHRTRLILIGETDESSK
ncbi:MAG: TIGR03936 family radical SAM-associated protein [Dehalococcoidia bacterium]|nr:TIGR03936 family radical SAM-associated protein [Dehalococcoidia bacterium]